MTDEWLGERNENDWNKSLQLKQGSIIIRIRIFFFISHGTIERFFAPVPSVSIDGIEIANLPAPATLVLFKWASYFLGSDWIQTSSGMRKAAVLPEPVSATPIMSRFFNPANTNRFSQIIKKHVSCEPLNKFHE